MKKGKNTVVVILILSILVSVTSVATFAIDTSYTDAQICEQIGMLKGDGLGVTDYYLTKSTTRLQAAIMYLRLIGYEEPALIFPEKYNFEDASEVAWAGGRSIMAYLKAHPELGWIGNPDGTFHPNDEISVKAYYKVMLEALGYEYGEDYDWEYLYRFAESVGIGKYSNVELFTNDDIAKITVEVLLTETKEGVPLIQKLVDRSIIDEESAVEIGLVEADVNDKYILEFVGTDKADIYAADGFSTVLMTALLRDKASGQYLEVDGTMTFNITSGTLMAREVNMLEGQATVQIVAPLHDELVNSYLTATITSDNGLNKYVGVTNQHKISFSPGKETDPNQLVARSIVSVDANQGDRYFVTFSGPLRVEDYKLALIDEVRGVNDWELLVQAGTYAGIFIDGHPTYILDIVQKSSNTLEFILDTDLEGSVAPNTNRIESGWIPVDRKSYLKDNANHVISVPFGVDNILVTSSGTRFILTDAKKPYIYRVLSQDSTHFNILFSEPVAEDAMETNSRGAVNVDESTPFISEMPGVNIRFLIDGKKVYLTHSKDGATSGERAFAKKNNLVLVNELYVGAYNIETKECTRDTVYFVVDDGNILNLGTHQVQIVQAMDWAGMVDSNNVSSTQTLDFTVTIY